MTEHKSPDIAITPKELMEAFTMVNNRWPEVGRFTPTATEILLSTEYVDGIDEITKAETVMFYQEFHGLPPSMHRYVRNYNPESADLKLLSDVVITLSMCDDSYAPTPAGPLLNMMLRLATMAAENDPGHELPTPVSSEDMEKLINNLEKVNRHEQSQDKGKDCQ